MEIQAKDGGKGYAQERERLSAGLVELVKAIAKQDGEDLDITLEQLADAMECRKLEIHLRQLHLGYLDITRHLRRLHSDEILRRRLLACHKTTIRLYVIDAYDLSSRDIGSASDPYLYIECDGKIHNERANY